MKNEYEDFLKHLGINPVLMQADMRSRLPDRDINAAKNILHKGVTSLGIVGREPSEIRNASGEPRSSMKEESSESSESIA